MKCKPSVIIILLWLVFISCDNGKAPLNPNGDSELALLMREMYDEGMEMKAQLQKGIKPKVETKYQSILTAEATEPEKVNTEDYKIFADSYISSVDILASSHPTEAKDSYHNMVESCMNCHKAMCPGPMVKIKKMYLPNKK